MTILDSDEDWKDDGTARVQEVASLATSSNHSQVPDTVFNTRQANTETMMGSVR